MRGRLGAIRIDREQALKAGALAGLVVLGISTLPGLLKTPEPPPVPADVGFRPAEMARYEATPITSVTDREKANRKRQREEAANRQKAKARRAAREKKRKPAHRKKRMSSPEGEAGKSAGSIDQAATPSTVTPVPVPTAVPPSPAPVGSEDSNPSPSPMAEPAPSPSDGSEEFAPR